MKNLFVLLFCLFTLLCYAQKPELVIATGHTNQITKMDLSKDGKIFATTSLDKTAKVYSYPNLKELFTFSPGWEPRQVFVSSDGKFVAASTIFGFKIADVSKGSVTKKVEQQDISLLGFHPSQPYLYYYIVDNYNIVLKKMDMVSFASTVVMTVQRRKDEVTLGRGATMFSNDGSYLLLGACKYLLNLNAKTFQKTEGIYFLPDDNILTILHKEESFSVISESLAGKRNWEKSFPKLSLKSAFDYMNALTVQGQDLYLIGIDNNVLFGDYKTGNLSIKQIPAEINSSIIIGTPDNALITANKEGQLYKLQSKNLSILEKYSTPSPYPYKIITGSQGTNTIALGTKAPYSEKIKVATLGKQGISLKSSSKTEQITALGLNKDGTTLGVGYEHSWSMAPVNDLNTLSKKGSPIGTPNTIGFTDDDSMFFLQSPAGFSLFKKGQSTAFQTVNKKYSYYHYDNHIADITKAGDRLAGYFIEKEGSNLPSKNYLRSYDLKSGKLLWEVTGEFRAVHYTENDAKVVAIKVKPLEVIEYDAKTGAQISSKTYINTRDERATLSSDGKYAAIYASKLMVYDISQQKNNTLQNPKSWQDKMAYFGNNFLMTIEDDGMLRLYDGTNSKFLATVIIYKNDEWAVVTEDGYFDGSQQAISQMYYRIGTKTVALEQFYEGFYTPGLLGQLLDRSFKPPSNIVIDDIKSPPSVTLKYEQGTRNLTVEDEETVEIIKTTAVSAKIIVNATAPNDKVAELRLYHNGKLITNKSRNLTVEDDVSNNTFNKIYEIELLPGVNSFKAVALNSQRTESSPAMLTVNLEGEKAKPKTQGIQLHMVVVGINEYKNPKYNLNYAVADASSFQDAIKNGMSTITSKVNVTFIKNSEADRNNIYSKLQDVANNANPQDVFIFYYAGHGMMSEDANPDFYLVPYDVTQIYGDDGGIKKKGISATELKVLASKIPAQKQLYVLDACQSAGALASVASRGAGEEKAIAQLARSTGTHWLTASGSQQFATEFDQLGHGIFTYVFLDALMGKADSGDGRITVNEIKAYLESQVPELSQKYNGSPQYPSSFGFGQDFPVGVKN